ncbi:MAG: B12-binding domain-containing protein [Myxococcales bacterium]|nr:B12-binding domain-containing protein [Myxococcales bacterium]
MSERDSRYRINVVAEMTGVPAPTLRAWERRYGIPTPSRTAAAYRLYSDRDVAMVRKLRDLCAGGLSIAEAAQMVLKGEADTFIEAPGHLDAFEAATRRIVAAVIAFDPDLLEREVSRAVYLGSAVTVFEQVLGPVMRQVGDLWHAGTLSVAQEHLASEVVGSVVRALSRLVQPPAPSRRVLLAAFEDEEHVLGLYGVAIRLASWGIRSVDLGARTPPEALADAVARLSPDAVALTLTIALRPERAAATLERYAQACAGVPWFVGGAGAAAVATRVERLGGVVLAGEAATLRAAIEQALAVKPQRP